MQTHFVTTVKSLSPYCSQIFLISGVIPLMSEFPNTSILTDESLNAKYPAITVRLTPTAAQATGPSSDAPVNHDTTAAIVPVPHPSAKPTPVIIAAIPETPEIVEIAFLISLTLSCADGATAAIAAIDFLNNRR